MGSLLLIKPTVEENVDVLAMEAPSSASLVDLVDLTLGVAGEKRVGGFSSGKPGLLLGIGDFVGIRRILTSVSVRWESSGHIE